MSQYQRLLLITDRSLYHSPALLRAVALAKASGAAFDIRAFIEPAPIIHLWEEHVDESAFQDYLHRYRDWLIDEVQRLGGNGLKVTVELLFTTHPVLEILRTIADLNPDLVIKDVKLEPVLKRIFITPLDCHLLRAVPDPPASGESGALRFAPSRSGGRRSVRARHADQRSERHHHSVRLLHGPAMRCAAASVVRL